MHWFHIRLAVGIFAVFGISQSHEIGGFSVLKSKYGLQLRATMKIKMLILDGNNGIAACINDSLLDGFETNDPTHYRVDITNAIDNKLN